MMGHRGARFAQGDQVVLLAALPGRPELPVGAVGQVVLGTDARLPGQAVACAFPTRRALKLVPVLHQYVKRLPCDDDQGRAVGSGPSDQATAAGGGPAAVASSRMKGA